MNSMPQHLESASEEKASDIRSMLTLFRRWWLLIAFCAVLGFVFGVYQLRSAVYTYPVQMQLTTVQSNSDDSPTGRLGGALGGLASLANVSLPTNQSGMQFRLYAESLRSRDIADEIAKNDTVMKYMFGGEWNEATRSWAEPPRTDTENFVRDVRAMLGLAPPAPWHAPNGENVLNFMNSNLQVQQDPRKPFLIKITLIHYDTQFAIRFLNLLNKTIDDHLRETALLRSRQYIDYLAKQLGTVTISEHRLAITQALGEQERFAMVANSGSPFAADVFERPWASTLPASPSPRQILAIGVLMGAALGCILVLLIRGVVRRWYSWRASRGLLIEDERI